MSGLPFQWGSLWGRIACSYFYSTAPGGELCQGCLFTGGIFFFEGGEQFLPLHCSRGVNFVRVAFSMGASLGRRGAVSFTLLLQGVELCQGCLFNGGVFRGEEQFFPFHCCRGGELFQGFLLNGASLRGQ